MVMKETDRIIALPRGSALEAIDHFNRIPIVLKRWDAFVEFVISVYELAPKAGVDPAIVIAQASHETDHFTSYWWSTRLNPAGLGITGTPLQDHKSRVFKNGTEAARAQIAHLQLYATGSVKSPLVPNDDPRYDAYITTYGPVSRARTIQDLGGTWATDRKYGPKIVSHGNAIFKNLGESRIEPEVTTAANAIIVDGKLWQGLTDVRINGILFTGSPRTVTVNVTTLNVREFAGMTSRIVGKYANGQKVRVYGWVRGDSVSGENRWWITETYARLWVGGTREKP